MIHNDYESPREPSGYPKRDNVHESDGGDDLMVSFPKKSRQQTFPRRPSPVVQEEEGSQSSSPHSDISSKSKPLAGEQNKLNNHHKRMATYDMGIIRDSLGKSFASRPRKGRKRRMVSGMMNSTTTDGDNIYSTDHESVSSYSSAEGSPLSLPLRVTMAMNGEDANAKSSLQASSVKSEERASAETYRKSKSKGPKKNSHGTDNSPDMIKDEVDEKNSVKMQDNDQMGEKIVFYGWGELDSSVSCSIESSSQIISSNGSCSRQKKMELHTDFPDREKFLDCDASFSESNVSGSGMHSTKDDQQLMMMMQDEYDSKRPWRKAPMIEVALTGKQSDASTCSFQTEGSVFKGAMSSAHNCVRVHENNEKKTNMNDVLGADDGNDDKGVAKIESGNKSVRSFKSSELSEIQIANEALRRSRNVLAGVKRPPIQRRLSVSSESNFTFTTQAYRKPEPFRPGPNPSSARPSMKRRLSDSTLDNIYVGSRLDHIPFASSKSGTTLGSTSIAGSSTKSFQSLLSLLNSKENVSKSLPSIMEKIEIPGTEPTSQRDLRQKMIPRKSQVRFTAPVDIESEINSHHRIDRRTSTISAITLESMNGSNKKLSREEYVRMASGGSPMTSRRSFKNDEDGSKPPMSSTQEDHNSSQSSISLGDGVMNADHQQEQLLMTEASSKLYRKDSLKAIQTLLDDLQEVDEIDDQPLGKKDGSHTSSLITKNLRDMNLIELRQVHRGSTLYQDYDFSEYNMDIIHDDNHSLAESSITDDGIHACRSRLPRRNSRQILCMAADSVLGSRPIARFRRCFCIPLRSKPTIIVFVTILIIATGMVLFFIYFTPSANKMRGDQPETDTDSSSSSIDFPLMAHPSPSPDIMVDDILFENFHSEMPSPGPTVRVTFWPTPVDTYTKVYPPPGSIPE